MWDRQSHAAPRVVIFDFDRVKFGRDDGNIFLTEETTLNRFLIELGAWQSGDIVTSWLEEGRGKTLYRSFGSDLLTPQGLKWRAEELAQGDLWRAKHAESARAWTERYDADCRRISPYDPLHTSDDALQAVLTEAELAATEQELAQQGWDAY